ncbi:MAG: hypothetical protein AAGG53_18020 [Cyanobacteria bacterium P01_H01_bin.152]
MRIKLFDDGAGEPGNLLQSFATQIDIEDTDGADTVPNVARFGSTFDLTEQFILGPGTYYIGMSGENSDLGQLGLTGASAPGNSKMWQLSGDTVLGETSLGVGDMAY